jgi:glycosyltransferase involved in cell wall biosynthesis
LVPAADHGRAGLNAKGTRIAVVVPCYNDGATLGETVDSVCEAEAVEIVVVDDGSTDHATVELLDRLAAEDRIELVRKTNGGVASALRAGFEAARAPYVFVLASDDMADAGALGELADALDASPAHDFAYGHSHHFGDVDFVRKAAPWNPWILLYSNLWEATCLFRREVVNAAGGFPSNSGYEDWDLFLALAEHGNVGLLVDRLVFHYRIHGGGRINPNMRSNFREHYRTLRRTHADLFAREPELRERYPLPAWSRELYRLQLAVALRLPPVLVRPLLDLKRRARPIVAWVDAARR